ncbi:T9SS type A sorting domain-containing protein [Flavobacterium hiemivividum]|uniref:T9SS type A sorting domain-containing protein n=1 Tax=Flavobacterium hiemivividum TaxID=2541734 RepID=A0A4R5CP09_9FLAO|nr:T9SS type A sorting domain-containing protein [Flavobacterium hiemivividum]TDE01117.1 T9SS type A sorting domain-containing protein [Flavobacterium hiemivividum]
MKYLLLLFSITFQGQVLHHQMLSSQGMTTKTAEGYIISQTIGQQSVTGNSNTKEVVMQGFQQSLWGSFIASNEKAEIVTRTYPNPFKDIINFEFSQLMPNPIDIHVFDISGRLVFSKEVKIENTILTVELANLPRSEYLVQLQTTNFKYYTKIIKQ